MSYLKTFPRSSLQDRLYNDGLVEPKYILSVFRHLMKDRSQLTHRQRELIGAYTLALTGVPQPLNVHTRNYALLGGEAWLIQDLVKDPDHCSAEEKMRPLLRICRRLTEQAHSVTKRDIDNCYDAGWDCDAINRTVMLCGAFNMMARWISGIGMKYSAEEIIDASNGLIQEGYGEGDTPGLKDHDYWKAVA